MHECSTGELLAIAAFMYHDDKGDNALRHNAALNGIENVDVADEDAWGRL